MKIFRNGLIAGVLVLTLGVTGCSSIGGEKWVAKVNGQTIAKADFDARALEIQKFYENQGMKFDTDEANQALDQVKGELLESMISHTLVGQDVKNQGINLDDPKVKEQEDNIKTMLGDEASFSSWLNQQGITEGEFKNYLALSTKVAEDVQVTDEQIKAFFDSNQEMYGGQPEQVKARHILVKTEEEAKDLIVQLQNGANFEQLAKDKSTEPGAAESGGDLGYFSKDKMVPEFEKAAFEQKVGTYTTTPVKTEFGYHVILVEDHKQAVQADFAQVKDQVAQEALADAKAKKFEAYFTELRNKASIEYAKGYTPAAA